MSRRRRTRRSAGPDEDRVKKLRLAAAAGAAVVVIAAVGLLAGTRLGGAGETAKESQTSLAVQQGDADSEGDTQTEIQPDNSRYEMDFSDYELQKDQIPAVSRLIGDYFQAKVDVDPEALYRVFGKTAQSQEELDERRSELEYEASEIQDYQDITCYTMQGLTEDSYVVYVTYEVKFRRVETLAPGLMWCYVVKDGDGNYIIRENVVGDEADYVAKANQTEDVRLLSSQVNERLREALASDTMLAGACKTLRDGAIVQPSEGDMDNKDSSVTLVTEPASQEETAQSQETSSQEETAQSQEISSQEEQTTGQTSQVRLAQ